MSFYSKNSTNVRFIETWNTLLRSAPRRLASVSPFLAAHWATARFFTPAPPRRSPAIETALSSARAFFLHLHGRRVAGWAWGDGPTIYLVHGWAGRGGQLRAFVAPLVQAGYRVVTFDAPAHGASPGRRTNIVEIASILEALTGLEGPAHAIIAHSVGAAASALALRRGVRANRVVFLGPLAHPGHYFQLYLEHSGIPATARARMAAQVERRIGFRWTDLDVPGMAPFVSTPALVIHDRHDAEIPWEEGRSISAAWPHARLVTTEGLGHRRILKDAAVIAGAVSFVAARPALSRGSEAGEASRVELGPSPVATEVEAQRSSDYEMANELFNRRVRWDMLPAN